jgi:hypothetical protein
MSNGNGVLSQSVTRDDHPNVKQNGMGVGLMRFVVPVFGPTEGSDLPAYWSPQRDVFLRRSIHLESMWSSALSKAITKIAAQGWEVEDSDESTLRAKRAQQLLLNAEENQGWVQFIGKHLRDFLTTDNGAFVEIVRASPAAGSKILGLVHLDSTRCIRTGDPDYPVIYWDRMGRYHQLRDYQVLLFVDMPSPDELYRGVGFCAASRAYRTIYKLAAMEQYLYEKASGSGATALEFLQGVSTTSFETAMQSADNQQVAKGAYYYKGVVVIPIMGDIPVAKTEVPLKGFSDGFDLEKERDNSYLIYANAIGIPVQDIKPLSGQGLGTGTQTVILAEAEEGQGLASWRKQWEHHMNEDVFPETTTFAWATKDLRDQQMAATVALTRAQARAAQIGSLEITPAIALQMAVDEGDVPPQFLPTDATPDDVLADDEKAEVEQIGTAAPEQAPAGQQPGGQQLAAQPQASITGVKPLAATKAHDPYADVRELLLDEDEAAALASEVSDADG